MKKMISVCLAALIAFSMLSTAVNAAGAKTIHVYDLLKYDVDGDTFVCRTIEIFFENQYKNYDSRKTITIQNADGSVAANCIPHTDNNRKFDLYTPDGAFGVAFSPMKLFYLVIPEGAYLTDDGEVNAAYRGEYNGIYLSGAGKTYKATDLGITNFLAGQMVDNNLFNGKLLFSTTFTSLLNGKDSVLLYRLDGGKEILVGTFSVTSYKSGKAEIEFGGVRVDRWAHYKLHVQYGAFYAKDNVVNDHSDYPLSGKKLLGLSEKYPAIDMLIELFGADHWTLKAVTIVLKTLAFVNLVDRALYNDINKYISARK